MNRRTIIGFAIGVAMIAALIAWLAWPDDGNDDAGGETSDARSAPGDDLGGDPDDELATWLDEGDERGRRRARTGVSDENEHAEPGANEESPEGWGRELRRDWDSLTPEEREARRARWIARWSRRVEIVPLGPEAPELPPERVVEAFGEHRGEIRDCVREAGGMGALRGGPGGDQRRRIGFDVGPDGRVAAGSVQIEPAVADPQLTRCVAGVVESMALGEIGGEGARVQLPLPGRRRRFGRDGGVGMRQGLR